MSPKEALATQSFNIDAQSFDVAFDKIHNDMDAVGLATINHLGKDIKTKAEETQKFNISQHFKDGITSTQILDNEVEVKAEVYNSDGVEYAQYMQFGNEPNGPNGMINPVQANALRFKIDGETVFRKWVRPIDKSKIGFFSDAVDEVSQTVQQVFTEELEKGR